MSSQKYIMKPQPLGTCERDLSWRSGLGRKNQFMMRSHWLWRALIQYDWMAGVLTGRGSGQRQTRREEGPMTSEAETEINASTSWGMPGATRNQKKQERSSPRGFGGSMALLKPRLQTFSFQNSKRINFCFLKPSKFVLICYDSPRKLRQ